MANPRKILRRSVTTLLALALLPVLNLNVERLAELKGWDQFLPKRWDLVVSSVSEIATNPWFLAALGAALGGTLFMWGDYFLRRAGYKPAPKSEPKYPIDPTQDELKELFWQIQNTKNLLDQKIMLTGCGEPSNEGFSEVMALIVKLTKYGISTPFIYTDDDNHATKEDEIIYESFNHDFHKFFSNIAPHIRDGDLKAIRNFAQIAVKNFGSDGNKTSSLDKPPEPQSP